MPSHKDLGNTLVESLVDCTMKLLEDRHRRTFHRTLVRSPTGPHLVRACALEMHMGISEGNFYARIYSEKARGQRAPPDEKPAFSSY